ncbi:hypothetical protein ACJ73_03182 [Blastomyces percursus]|uniref:Uncharacterized protein n=1 Tax=Blastomyces percursus TaxID=1658174 RepID=A0A1J9QBL1_9EURO|nr:hypothetical protein ACJ73_03182 [Blastomyces percursus]
MEPSSLPSPKKRRSRLSSSTDRFKFTPKAESKKAPRLWDRKPMTPFSSRYRSHKVWKRFLASSLNHVGGDGTDYDAFLTEINESSTLRGVLRGVKRRCTAACVGVERGRSFLETKWEMEDMGARKREDCPISYSYLVAARAGLLRRREIIEDPCFIPAADDIKQDSHFEYHGCVEEQKSGDQKQFGLDFLAFQRDSTSVASRQANENELWEPQDPVKLDEQGQNIYPSTTRKSIGTLDLENLESGGQIAPDLLLDAENTFLATAKIEKVAEEAVVPLATPPSRLLFPTLEGDDADFLTDFLSQAQAKRAATKSTFPNKESENASCYGPTRSPTPRPRRVLEDLDKISPSSPRQQVSPSKLKQVPTSPSPKPPPVIDHTLETENEERVQRICGETEEDLQQPRASTPWRRSTRKIIPRTQRYTPTVPNHIPVRRSNGTEFVFLQRSEEQQLSLTTKANTRRNKGDAQFPCFVLQAINSKEYDPFSSNNGETGDPVSPKKSRRKRIRIVKKVMWDDEHLVRYEGEPCNNDEHDAEISAGNSSPKPAISQAAKREGKKRKDQGPNNTTNKGRSNKKKPAKPPASAHSNPQPAKSPIAMRRVPRLGFSDVRSTDHNNSSLALASTITTTRATEIIASPHPGTPIQRKKLALKSPKALVFKISDDRTPKTNTATATGLNGSSAPTTRAAARKFGGSCLPRHTRRSKV